MLELTICADRVVAPLQFQAVVGIKKSERTLDSYPYGRFDLATATIRESLEPTELGKSARFLDALDDIQHNLGMFA
jgi:hypothetical protein